MARLRAHDFQRLQEVLPRVYALRNRETFGRELIALLPSVIGCDSCSYNELDLKKGANEYHSHPRIPPLADHNRIFRRFMHEHPLLDLGRYANRPRLRAAKFSDFVGRREFERLGIYNEYFRPLGIEHQMGISIAPPDMRRLRATAVALNRSRPDFNECDRLCLILLRPHLRMAFDNVQKFDAVRRDIAFLARGIDELNRAVIILDGPVTVRYASAAARRFFCEIFGERSLQDSRLPEDVARWVQAQENIGFHCDPRASFVRRMGHATLTLVRNSDWRLLLIDEHSPAQAMLEPFGLTPREAEVLAWTCRGKTNADIAAILDISPRTVEKHLERIFPKLGVETRSAATSFAHRLMAPGSYRPAETSH